jgi:hypothetical protein
MRSEPSGLPFERAGYQIHHWAGPGGGDVLVLQKEPFRFSWLATRLVTFVFLIRQRVETYPQVLHDYPALRKFA